MIAPPALPDRVSFTIVDHRRCPVVRAPYAISQIRYIGAAALLPERGFPLPAFAGTGPAGMTNVRSRGEIGPQRYRLTAYRPSHHERIQKADMLTSEGLPRSERADKRRRSRSVLTCSQGEPGCPVEYNTFPVAVNPGLDGVFSAARLV